MTRAPIPGAVKTRLQARLTPEQCAELHKAFLLDTLDLTSKFKKAAVFLAFTPKRHRQFFEKMLLHPAVLLPQQGNDLGKRMYGAIKEAFSEGYSPVIVIGSDSPSLQPSHIDKAFEALKTADVCLGPSRDGGYYLIGTHRPHKELFEDIPWGENKVFATTLERARGVGLKTSILPGWYDVDAPDDLIYLRAELTELRKLPEAFIPTRTDAFLQHRLADVL